MLEGWHFLRHETVLLANTIQGVVGQFAIGATIAITALYATVSLDRGNVPAMAAYGFLETGVGVGNLIGGFLVGLIGARLAKGRMVIVGYTIWGICVASLGLTRSLPFAIGLLTATGVANMIFVIPSQTLFQQRTPTGADRPGRRLPDHARLRLDDPRDGRRRAARDGDRAGRGDDDPGHGDDRVRAGRAASSPPSATPEACRGGTARCACKGPWVHWRACPGGARPLDGAAGTDPDPME